MVSVFGGYYSLGVISICSSGVSGIFVIRILSFPVFTVRLTSVYCSTPILLSSSSTREIVAVI